MGRKCSRSVAGVCRASTTSRTFSRQPFSCWPIRRQPSPGTNRWKAGCAPWPAGWSCMRVPVHGNGKAGSDRSLPWEEPGLRNTAAFCPIRIIPSTIPTRKWRRRDIRRVLHAALGQLPEKYRAPVVLCYLEGKTNEEAARQLGWPAGTMSRRCSAALTAQAEAGPMRFVDHTLRSLCGIRVRPSRAARPAKSACDRFRASGHAVAPLSLGVRDEPGIAAPAITWGWPGFPRARTGRGSRS